MHTHRIVILVALFLIPVPPLHAQQLEERSLVRIHLETRPTLTGQVRRLGADTLWVQRGSSLHAAPLTEIARLELRERMTRMESGWTWGKRGFVAGALLGGITCLADHDNCRAETGDRDSLVEGLLGATLFVGGGVALLGFSGGALVPGRRWVEVPLPAPVPWTTSPWCPPQLP